MLAIKVTHVGRGTRSNVLASAKVELTSEDGQDTVTVCDARVLRNKSGELWVGFHSQTLGDGDGRVQYVPTIEFSPGLKRRISVAVLEAYEHYREDQKVVGVGERRDFPEMRQAPDPDSGRQIRLGGPRGTLQPMLQTALQAVRGEYRGR